MGLIKERYVSRWRRAQELMQRQGLDLLLVAPGSDLLYLLGGRGHISERMTMLALPSDGRPSLLIGALEAPAFDAWGDEIDKIAAVGVWGDVALPIPCGDGQRFRVGSRVNGGSHGKVTGGGDDEDSLVCNFLDKAMKEGAVAVGAETEIKDVRAGLSGSMNSAADVEGGCCGIRAVDVDWQDPDGGAIEVSGGGGEGAQVAGFKVGGEPALFDSVSVEQVFDELKHALAGAEDIAG